MTEEEIQTQIALGSFNIEMLIKLPIKEFRQIINNIKSTKLLFILQRRLDHFVGLPGLRYILYAEAIINRRYTLCDDIRDEF